VKLQISTAVMLLSLTACTTAPTGQPTTCPPPTRLPALDPLPAAAQTSFSDRMQRWLSGSLATPTWSE